jgi:hypothetical protein
MKGLSMRSSVARFTIGVLLALSLGALVDAHVAPLGAWRTWLTPRDTRLVAPRTTPAVAPQGAPAVSTDRTGYLFTQTVIITGQGFVPGDSVTLRVTHAGGGAESGAGHDPFFANASDDGSFTAEWSIDAGDAAGHEFVVSAQGALTGAAASFAFQRIASVIADKFDYAAGETAVISGNGFNPGELVAVRVQHSNGLNDNAHHIPYEVTADVNGAFSHQWYVDPSDSLNAIMRVTAKGTSSNLLATTTFTDPPTTIVDDQGADDEPGQKDLNSLTVDETAAPGQIAILWNWDDTVWSGNNTGDACSLFDTDGDGRANYSLCVVVKGNPASFQSIRLYSCDDLSSDRCSGSTAITTFASSATASVVPNSDPFGVPSSPHFNAAHLAANKCSDTPACRTSDTVANVTVVLSDFGAAAARLINVCSYPSQQPNSAPAECVVTANNGLLRIVKVDNDNTSTPFNFSLGAGQAAANGQSSWTINGSGSVQSISLAPGTTYDLTEAIPSGWQLTSVSCAIQSSPTAPTGTADGTPINGPATRGIQDFEIRSGLETICTFTDRLQRGSIQIVKATDGGDGTFSFTPSGFNSNSAFTLTTSGGSASSTFAGLLTTGTYSVSETVPDGWELVSSSCTNGTPTAITVVDGQTTTCTFTNKKQAPSLSLAKQAAPTTYNAAGQVIGYTYLLTNTGNVPIGGPFTVSDDKASATCPATASLAAGASITCTANYTITQADVDTGSVTNTATGQGTFSGQPVISNTASATITATQTPALTLDKSSGSANFDAPGDTLSYSYLLTNTGNVTLVGPFTVADDRATVTCPATPAALAPGASITCTATYTVTQADIDAGFVKNTATGHASFKGNAVDSNTDSETVNAIQTAALSLDKSTTTANFDSVGDTISYSYLLTNTGNVTLVGPFTVTDDKATVTCPATPAALAPGT